MVTPSCWIDKVKPTVRQHSHMPNSTTMYTLGGYTSTGERAY